MIRDIELRDGRTFIVGGMLGGSYGSVTKIVCVNKQPGITNAFHIYAEGSESPVKRIVTQDVIISYFIEVPKEEDGPTKAE